jgi:hypothetical protein
MSDTPETQEAVERWNQGKINIFDEMARLERERDDYMERCRFALSERDSWRMRAEQKYAMRRELEELLGVDQKDASDEQFQKGLDAIKNIIGERDEARFLLKAAQSTLDAIHLEVGGWIKTMKEHTD